MLSTNLSVGTTARLCKLLIVIFYFRYRGKRYLYQLTVGAFHFHARSSKSLRSFHTPDRPTHSLAVKCNDLHIIFAVKRLESREGFGHFHVSLLQTCLLHQTLGISYVEIVHFS